MNPITVTQAKPNPYGKDRIGRLTPSSQLLAEWVDITNIGTYDCNLENLILQHVAYTKEYPNGVYSSIMNFKGILPSGKTIRIHSGHKTDESNMNPEDRNGADYHLFTGEDYVWNNIRNDTARIKDVSIGQGIDAAEYIAPPPEGIILKRRGDMLVPY